jgi:hypothetical protein
VRRPAPELLAYARMAPDDKVARKLSHRRHASPPLTTVHRKCILVREYSEIDKVAI